jgi:hypothetical protein
METETKTLPTPAEVGPEIAQHLEGDWTVELTDNWDHAIILCEANGVRLYVGVNQEYSNHKKSFSISGDYPALKSPPDPQGRTTTTRYSARYGETLPSIGCSRTKSGKQVARDIERRLLEDVREHTATWNTQREEWRQHEEGAHGLAAHLAEVTGGRVCGDGTVLDIPKPDGNGGYIHEARVSSPNSVRMTFWSLTAEQAERILLAYLGRGAA